MGYLPEITIAEAVRRIHKGDLILPAIQREYVWKPSQVMGLFDSLMRGYPVGGFLSWKVEPETATRFRFYGFMKDYNAFDNRHNPDADPVVGSAVTAVLDGQQRLTSFNIGLRGTYSYKLPRAWSNLATSYPTRRLYLNVLGEAEENEAGLRYDFRFLTDAQFTAASDHPERHWFAVQRVFKAEKMQQLWAAAAQDGLANHNQAVEILGQLWESIHSTATVKFFEETEQDIDRVLDIFIRVNSAGTVLSYSDLLLSIATAQWTGRDARAAIHGLVDDLNSAGAGFNFTQDIVLKSGLVLAGVSDIAFKVKNFTAETMATLDRQWDSIAESLRLAVGLLSDFGLSGATLTASSVVIPVAFYVHHRQLGPKYREAVADSADREALRKWVLRSLIVPGVWGAGLDTLLRDLRQTIATYGSAQFPAAEIERRMAQRGKSLDLSDDQIEEILNLTYGRPRTFAVLAVLFPHVNTRNVHQVDHIYPQALLSRKELKASGLDRDEVERLQGMRDLLPNLQLLEMSVNISKSATAPAKWAASLYSTPDTQTAYLERNEIPWLPESPKEFEGFFTDRRKVLAARIKRLLAAEPAAPGGRGDREASVPATIDEDLSLTDLAAPWGGPQLDRTEESEPQSRSRIPGSKITRRSHLQSTAASASTAPKDAETAPSFDVRVIDSREMAEARRRELDLDRDTARRLGEEAVRSIEQGWYAAADGRRVPWSEAVKDAKRRTLSVAPQDNLPAGDAANFSETIVEVANQTSLAAARRLVEDGSRPLVLNMANGLRPGGGFLNGARAQEESLCRSSALYATLVGDPMYTEHSRRPQPDSTDWVILSPDVPVFRNDDAPLDAPWLASFATCAAPYAPRIGQPGSGDLLEGRIERLLRVAHAYRYTALVLGAWGCGAFANDPARTAQDFRRHFEDNAGAFEHVVFAITDWSSDRSLLGPFAAAFSS